MGSDFRHRILIVEGDDRIQKIIAGILDPLDLDTVFAETAGNGIDAIANAAAPFSLIISAQILDDMPGTQFLEQAKNKAPDSIRFLMARVSELQTIIQAVNQSAIQRFFIKPFEADDFHRAVRSGLNRFNITVEHKRLLRLAKKQNSRLYELNCELMEGTTAHTRAVQELESEVSALEADITALESGDAPCESTLETIQKALPAEDPGPALADLHAQVMQSLFSQFDELALRNGFEMPRPIGPETDDPSADAPSQSEPEPGPQSHPAPDQTETSGTDPATDAQRPEEAPEPGNQGGES